MKRTARRVPHRNGPPVRKIRTTYVKMQHAAGGFLKPRMRRYRHRRNRRRSPCLSNVPSIGSSAGPRKGTARIVEAPAKPDRSCATDTVDCVSLRAPPAVSIVPAFFRPNPEIGRSVAQPGSAPDWGSGGPGFKSRRSDQYFNRLGDIFGHNASPKTPIGNPLGNNRQPAKLSRG